MEVNRCEIEKIIDQRMSSWFWTYPPSGESPREKRRYWLKVAVEQLPKVYQMRAWELAFFLDGKGISINDEGKFIPFGDNIPGSEIKELFRFVFLRGLKPTGFSSFQREMKFYQVPQKFLCHVCCTTV